MNGHRSFEPSRAGGMIETAEHHGVTRDELISAAFDVLDLAREGTPIVDEHGQPIPFDGEPMFAADLPAANRAIETVARLCGFLIERREVTILGSDGMSGHVAEVVKLEVIEGGEGGETPVAG